MNLIKIWTSLVTAMFICVCLSSTCSFFFFALRVFVRDSLRVGVRPFECVRVSSRDRQ